MHYGWAGSIQLFLTTPLPDWLVALQKQYKQATRNEHASASQLAAWTDSFNVLRSQFGTLLERAPYAGSWACVFEHELPREGGRRPDLVLLAGGTIIVVEFKEKARADQADIDQASAYAKDLASYHAQSHNRPVIPVLIPTKATGAPSSVDRVRILPPEHLAAVLVNLVPANSKEQIDPAGWADADYAPLPFLVDAARHIFKHDPLPYIRRAYAEAQIPAVLHYLRYVAERARQHKERHLVLLTGAPGAGKTLVGLQFVHDRSTGVDQAVAKTAVFLSGNGPLIQVLQHALRSSVFVQEVHHFVKQYGVRRPDKIPNEHVLVFDEAQRAWSRDKMLKEHNVDASEPDIFVQIAERIPDWAVVIGLIGEGQEIHVGEEAGLGQWNESIRLGKLPWYVHTPAVSDLFSAARQTEVADLLNLSTSLRTHVARGVQQWVSHLLSGQIAAAKRLAPQIRREGFHMYVTQSVEAAKAYVRERYRDQPMKRYGLVASSKPSRSVVDDHGVPRDYQTTKRLKYGPWYNDPPPSQLSCCALDAVVTEFGCQGLELDMPIVCWGNDVWWESGRWDAMLLPRDAQEPYQLRMNAYRVLLSRGRDGFVLWIPPVAKLQETYNAVIQAGVSELPHGSRATVSR